MDVILLAAGIGERMQPLSSYYPKQVAPIAGIPIMVRLMESFKEVGCNNFIVVKSPDCGEMVEKVVSNVEGAQVQYVVQDPPRGMGDAIRCVKEQLTELPSEFVLSATDVLYGVEGIKSMVDLHAHSGADSTLSLLYSSDNRFAKGHGNVAVSEDLNITQIIEKPGQDNILSNYYSMPTYIFKEDIFNQLDQIPPSPRGEIEIQDAIQFLINLEKPVQGAVIIPGDVKFSDVGKFHITTVADFLQMSGAYLSGIQLPPLDEFPTTIEPVLVEEGVTIGDSCFLGPKVYIRPGCILANFVEITESVIFENATINAHAKLRKCVVLPGATIAAGAKLTGQIITEDETLPLTS
ncbi:MAG TPA: NDP-sugar synthase [Candidatus Lokiarchaeia archaeon]|nr:NDP-sugar synthase [Candidatus Lokiarchaeia archaeon]